jgi:hypothetical protein
MSTYFDVSTNDVSRTPCHIIHKEVNSFTQLTDFLMKLLAASPFPLEYIFLLLGDNKKASYYDLACFSGTLIDYTLLWSVFKSCQFQLSTALHK